MSGSLTSLDDALISEMEMVQLKQAIERLPKRARYVLVMRYGLDDRRPATLAELSRELEISQERVRQLQRQAEDALKSEERCWLLWRNVSHARNAARPHQRAGRPEERGSCGRA